MPMTLDRRGLGAAVLGALPWPRGARAQASWPTRPVRIVVPFAPAGPADAVMRVVAERLGAVFGQPFLIENRPGSAGSLGMEAAARSRPDGYTLVSATRNQTINETIQSRLPHRLLRDFTPIAGINVFPLVLGIANTVPADSLAELIAHAGANPGRLNYASNGIGSIWHISTELFCSLAGVTMQHIPYARYNEARTALVAGQIDLMFDAVATLAPLIQAGRVRGLATTGTRRAPLLGDLGLVSAVLPGFEAAQWTVLLGPADLPRPIVDRLNGEIGRFLAEPASIQAQEANGANVLPLSPEDLADFLQRDVDRARAIVQRAGIPIE